MFLLSLHLYKFTSILPFLSLRRERERKREIATTYEEHASGRFGAIATRAVVGNNWDAESNRKHDDGVHDDFDDEKDDENKKYLFGDGKKHRYVRYMLNVPMKLGRMKRVVILAALVGFLVLFSVFSGRSESRISTTGATMMGTVLRQNHHHHHQQQQQRRRR